jgi:tetratricopeptide (TPR) repeat protein
VHEGDLNTANSELSKLKIIHDTLVQQGNNYQANMVDIQWKTGKAWVLLKEKKYSGALALMKEAADMEDATQKHPVTPGEVIPARELLGDMLMEMGYYARALEAYRADLQLHSKRFNGLYGAGLAAKKSGDTAQAGFYFRQLSDQCVINSKRPELNEVRAYLKRE